MKYRLLFLLALLACTEAPTEPLQTCATIDQCPRAVSVKFEPDFDAFVSRPGGLLLQGDSFVVRTTYRNRTNLTLDSLRLLRWGTTLNGWTGLDTPYSLHPGQAVAIVDTVVVADFTFDQHLGLGAQVSTVNNARYSDVPFIVSGDTLLPIARSGYKIGTIVTPPRERIRHDDHFHEGPRVKHNSTLTTLVEVINPYSTPLRSIHVGACLWDYDYCFVTVHSADSTHVLAPGASEYLEFSFVVDTKAFYFEWWTQSAFTMSICGEDGYHGRDCQNWGLLITANFDADCKSVPTIRPGSLITDNDPECGIWKDGSAYKFVASKGDVYRATSIAGGAEVFLTGANGVFELDPRTPQMTIPSDGTYYLVALHRGSSPVSFRLDYLQ